MIELSIRNIGHVNLLPKNIITLKTEGERQQLVTMEILKTIFPAGKKYTESSVKIRQIFGEANVPAIFKKDGENGILEIY